MVPAVPWDTPGFACSPEARQPAGPVCAAGDVAADDEVPPLAPAWTVTVLVGPAAPGAGVVPQAVSSAQALAAAAAASSRPARVKEEEEEEVMCPFPEDEPGQAP